MTKKGREDVVEVFVVGDRFGAQAAIDEVLRPAGIEAVIHDRTSGVIAAPASLPGGYFVAVSAEDAAAATTALRDAQSAGALSKDGAVIDDAMA